MARISNRDRIAREAEEARLAEAEKLAKKAATKAAKRPSKLRTKEIRMKIVWVVCNDHGNAVKTSAYPDKAAGHERGSAPLQLHGASPRASCDQSANGH